MVNSDAHLELAALARDLSAASGEPFKQTAHNLVAEATSQVETFAQAYTPVKTGDNLRHITSRVSGMSGTVTANSDHSKALEYGTGTRGEFPGSPIEIHAKPGGVLRFVVNGKVVYAKKVVSQGMAPRPYMRPAAERVALPFAQTLGDNAVLTIVHGPNTPETLQNAPASSERTKAEAQALSLVKTGAQTAKSVSTAKRSFA